MSTTRRGSDRDLRQYSSRQHIDGNNDNAPASSASGEKKDKSRGLFSRMFGSTSHAESVAELNYRRKMTENTEEQQQQHPYYHSSNDANIGANRERERERTREREIKDKERDTRDRDKDKEKDRDREHRTERERDKEKDRDKDRDRERDKDKDREKDSSNSSRSFKDKDPSKRERGDGSRDGREKEHHSSGSSNSSSSRDRDRSREQHSQSFSHSSPPTTESRRYHTSSSNVFPDPPKKSSSRMHSSSTANILSSTGKASSTVSEEHVKASGASTGSHENAYLSSLLSTSSPLKSHRESSNTNSSSSSSSAPATKTGSGGVSAGGSSSTRHNSSTDYDFGSSSLMHMSPGNGIGITPSHQTLFLEMNRMFDVTGIKFDRSAITAGEAIAILGDQHLAKLEDMCKKILASILSDKESALNGLSKDPNSVSNGQGHTEVALIFTEVLQLQGRPQEAVVILSKAIEELNSDLAEAKRQRSKKDPQSDTSSILSGRTTSQSLEFDHLKKMKALCHRRIGSLYKLTNRLKDAEEHIKRYISIIERLSSTDAVKREMALAYSLLTSIYDAMGKTAEAQAADKVAIELASTLGRVE